MCEVVFQLFSYSFPFSEGGVLFKTSNIQLNSKKEIRHYLELQGGSIFFLVADGSFAWQPRYGVCKAFWELVIGKPLILCFQSWNQRRGLWHTFSLIQNPYHPPQPLSHCIMITGRSDSHRSPVISFLKYWESCDHFTYQSPCLIHRDTTRQVSPELFNDHPSLTCCTELIGVENSSSAPFMCCH